MWYGHHMLPCLVCVKVGPFAAHRHNKDMTILLFANGDLEDVVWLESYIDQAAVIIAADGGSRHLASFKRIPTVLLGDFDSLDSVILTDFIRQGSKVVRYPADKNETDLELALLYAAEQPQWTHHPILVTGVLGGRLDQTLANLLLLAHPALHGRDVRIIAPHQTAWLVTEESEISGAVGDIVSLVPMGGAVKIKQTTGLKWPLTNETLFFGPARGISNQLTSPNATVSVGDGQLLCIHIDQTWGR